MKLLKETQEAKKEMLKACICLFIEVDESIAQDIQDKAELLIAAYERELALKGTK